MNRIPTEGLKLSSSTPTGSLTRGLNEQNPDRGIETVTLNYLAGMSPSLNEQNPDRGIETDEIVENWQHKPVLE